VIGKNTVFKIRPNAIPGRGNPAAQARLGSYKRKFNHATKEEERTKAPEASMEVPHNRPVKKQNTLVLW